MMELEDEINLKDEDQSLRSLMLEGYIAREQHPKLRQIGQTLRHAGRNQLQHLIEIILVVEAEEPVPSESLDRSASATGSDGANGLPRRPSRAIRLRRKAEQGS